MTPWTVARQAPWSMGFPRQEHWSGLPFPPSEDLPNSGTEPESPALAGEFFAAEPPGKPLILISTSTKLKTEHSDFKGYRRLTAFITKAIIITDHCKKLK